MKTKTPPLPLEVAAMEYLRYGRQCHIVMRERGMDIARARPDVLGITRERFMIEVEVKRTMADFRAVPTIRKAGLGNPTLAAGKGHGGSPGNR